MLSVPDDVRKEVLSMIMPQAGPAPVVEGKVVEVGKEEATAVKKEEGLASGNPFDLLAATLENRDKVKGGKVSESVAPEVRAKLNEQVDEGLIGVLLKKFF